eukprot:1018315-Alexandrium_andersonii.AAC.1
MCKWAPRIPDDARVLVTTVRATTLCAPGHATPRFSHAPWRRAHALLAKRLPGNPVVWPGGEA